MNCVCGCSVFDHAKVYDGVRYQEGWFSRDGEGRFLGHSERPFTLSGRCLKCRKCFRFKSSAEFWNYEHLPLHSSPPHLPDSRRFSGVCLDFGQTGPVHGLVRTGSIGTGVTGAGDCRTTYYCGNGCGTPVSTPLKWCSPCFWRQYDSPHGAGRPETM